MKLDELIHQLQTNLDEADVYLDAGDKEEARAYLRRAKQLLDDEFLNE